MSPSIQRSKSGGRRASKQCWLERLERELHRRIGWTDETVSPFARKRRLRATARRVRRAA